MTNERTAIIKQITIGKTDYHTGIVAICEFDMNNAYCSLVFSMDEIDKMMDDACVYDDVFEMVGLPCQVTGGWGEHCKFKGMWKRK